VNGSRDPIFLAFLGAALLPFSGCGQGSEPADSSSAQPLSAQPLSAQPLSTQVTPSKAGWITSVEQGQQEAKANNKLMLLDFTGSDWCGWCKLLDREVFSKPQFKEYADRNLVLVEVDFPKLKPMSEAVRAQNTRLAMQYQVEGFPTIVVLNGDGKVVGSLGYLQGGPAAFIAVLEKLRKG
jgi:thioredoxin-related protein